MNAYYGGFSTAFMSVGYTLPAIYFCGLIGAYHDWCAPFSTYPRSYNLLHGFHLFSHYKGCVEGYDIEDIMLEMDHNLSSGFIVIRDEEYCVSTIQISNPSSFGTSHYTLENEEKKMEPVLVCRKKF